MDKFIIIHININMKYSLHQKRNTMFWVNKRLFDVVISLLLLPLLLIISIFLLFLNPFYNAGKLVFIQERMGINCEAFFAIKFRTMSPIEEITRKYDDPIEKDRITPLGKILRRSRIDELPQILNVLRGDMSLIGPRPDYYAHALEYLKNVEGYYDRHNIRPGITGLSQVTLGYVESLDLIIKKVSIDNYYIQNVGYIIELKIIYSTILVIIRGIGK